MQKHPRKDLGPYKVHRTGTHMMSFQNQKWHLPRFSMQLVHLHPGFEKQRSLQRKLTKWWSQLNAKASLEKDCPYKVHRTGSYDELPKSEVTSRKIFGGEGRNGMIPHLNNAAYSKAEPHKNQFCFEQLLGTSFLLLTQDAVFSWQLCPHTNRSTPCSYYGHSFSWIPTVTHSRIVYHVDIAICPDDLKWP